MEDLHLLTLGGGLIAVGAALWAWAGHWARVGAAGLAEWPWRQGATVEGGAALGHAMALLLIAAGAVGLVALLARHVAWAWWGALGVLCAGLLVLLARRS